MSAQTDFYSAKPDLTSHVKAGPLVDVERQEPPAEEGRQAAYTAEFGYQSWMTPLHPFQEPRDWTCAVDLLETEFARGYKFTNSPWPDSLTDLAGVLMPVDKRVESQAAMMVHLGDQAHREGKHEGAQHPHCAACGLVWRRSTYMGEARKNADRTDEDLLVDEQRQAIARARGFALRPPAHLTPQSAAPIERGPLFLSKAERAERPGLQWIVPGFVPAASVGILYGPSGSMKSFVCLDLLAHIATSADTWHGPNVGTWIPDEVDPDFLDLGYDPSASPVMYVPGEGQASVDTRLNAWEQHHGTPIADGSLLVAEWMPDFHSGEGFDRLLAAAEELKPSLIVVDTMRKAAGASEENSATERGVVIDRAYALSRASGGTVLFVAHSGLAEGRLRGSTAQFADVDFVLQVKREENVVTISTDKMKDGDDDREIVLNHQTAGESVVLVDPLTPYPGASVVWSSTRLQDAIYAFVAGQVAGGNSPTQADLVALGRDEHDVSRSVVQRATAGLVTRDLLAVQSVSNSKHYRLGSKPWPTQDISEGGNNAPKNPLSIFSAQENGA